jgi:hypothetical protein
MGMHPASSARGRGKWQSDENCGPDESRDERARSLPARPQARQQGPLGDMPPKMMPLPTELYSLASLCRPSPAAERSFGGTGICRPEAPMRPERGKSRSRAKVVHTRGSAPLCTRKKASAASGGGERARGRSRGSFVTLHLYTQFSCKHRPQSGHIHTHRLHKQRVPLYATAEGPSRARWRDQRFKQDRVILAFCTKWSPKLQTER